MIKAYNLKNEYLQGKSDTPFLFLCLLQLFTFIYKGDEAILKKRLRLMQCGIWVVK